MKSVFRKLRFGFGFGTSLACGIACASLAHAEWPEWRGPTGDGVSTDPNLPVQWSASERESRNVLWKTPLDGLGTSTPIVWGDWIFLTAQLGAGPIDGRGAEFPEAVPARHLDDGDAPIRFGVYAFDVSDGRLVWSVTRDASPGQAATKGRPEFPAVHPKHNLASPSCATDGELVYAWFGTGQLLALTLEGDVAWERHLGEEFGVFDVLWGHGSSPKLLADSVVLLVDHPERAYMLAVDKKTGNDVWHIERPAGIRSYTTPFLIERSGRNQLIVNSSHRIEALDPKTGNLLWHAGEPVTLAIPVPVYDDGVLYASRGYSSGPYSAIRVDDARGDLGDSHTLWHVPTRAPYISSLVLAGGVLFMATERGVLSAVDSVRGETLFRERLGGAFTASPVAGDGKVYFTNESGDTFVIEASRRFSLLATNSLGERTLASPAIAGGRIYIRTDVHLFAIGPRQKTASKQTTPGGR